MSSPRPTTGSQNPGRIYALYFSHHRYATHRNTREVLLYASTTTITAATTATATATVTTTSAAISGKYMPGSTICYVQAVLGQSCHSHETSDLRVDAAPDQVAAHRSLDQVDP